MLQRKLTLWGGGALQEGAGCRQQKGVEVLHRGSTAEQQQAGVLLVIESAMLQPLHAISIMRLTGRSAVNSSLVPAFFLSKLTLSQQSAALSWQCANVQRHRACAILPGMCSAGLSCAALRVRSLAPPCRS